MELENNIKIFAEETLLSKQQNTENSSLDIPNSGNSASSKLTFPQQALNLLYGDKPWICTSNKLYYWAGTHYQHSPDSVERHRIADFCNSFVVDTKKAGVAFPYAKPASVSEVLQWAKYCFEVNSELINPPGLNCTNGVLQIEWQGPIPRWKLIAHTPNLYYIYEPVATYLPNADPTSCSRLLSVLDKPQREIFLRTIAASLDLATVRRHKGRLVRGLLLKGDGNNGKDTLREAVAAMYGYQGMTGCTLSDFKAYDDGRKSPLARLKNSRVNWGTENVNTASLDKLQSIKAFLTGDILSAKSKGKDEIDYKPSAVGLFNINDTPNFKGNLEAVASRWGVLSFTKTFKINADPSKGELEADPRFKYDPEFLHKQVLPAFLNRVLQALVDLMQEGIDYSCTQKALEDIQRENSHLFQFCQDTGLSYDPNSTLLAIEIWNRLEQWYRDNGTLSYSECNNGKRIRKWNNQLLESDKNVKAVNQVISRFKVLFPSLKEVCVPKSGGGKPRKGLQGIGFNQPALPQASPNSAQDDTQISPNTSPQESLQDKVFHPSHPISSISEAQAKQLSISDYLPNFLPSQVKDSDFREINEEAGRSIKFLPSQVKDSDSGEINEEAGRPIKFLPSQVKDSDSGEINEEAGRTIKFLPSQVEGSDSREINEEAGRFINVGCSIESSFDNLIQKLNKCFQKVRAILRNRDVVSIEPTKVIIFGETRVRIEYFATRSDGKLMLISASCEFSKKGLKIMQFTQSDGLIYHTELMRARLITPPPYRPRPSEPGVIVPKRKNSTLTNLDKIPDPWLD